MATNSRRPASGATRNGASKSKISAAKRPQGAARKAKAAPPRRRMLRGRVIVFFALAGLLAYGIWLLSQRTSAPVESLPSALSVLDEAPQEHDKAPAPAPKKTAERFEFYDILPNQRVLPSRTPDARSPARPTPKAPAAVIAEKPANSATNTTAQDSMRWLQVGAFRDSAQAIKRVQQLKALAIPAQRQSGFDAQGKPLDRVVAGPFDSARQLDEARTRLANEGLDAIPLSSLGDSQ